MKVELITVKKPQLNVYSEQEHTFRNTRFIFTPIYKKASPLDEGLFQQSLRGVSRKTRNNNSVRLFLTPFCTRHNSKRGASWRGFLTLRHSYWWGPLVSIFSAIISHSDLAFVIISRRRKKYGCLEACH